MHLHRGRHQSSRFAVGRGGSVQHDTATLCNTLLHTAAYCNILHSNTQHRTATPCTTLQHTVIYCNRFTHTYPQGSIPKFSYQSLMQQKFATRHCNALQHPATPCNVLQHTAAHSHHACTQGSTPNSRVGRGDTVQHDTANTAPPCTTLHYPVPHCNTNCNTHRNTPQHTATYLHHACTQGSTPEFSCRLRAQRQCATPRAS